MTTTDDFHAIVATLRGWGFKVVERSGCYGRSNGLAWHYGEPVGHVNHHYVCSLNSSQSYIDSLVDHLVAETTVNWFADVNGCAYLIGTGPMNHSGTGMTSVLDRVMADLPPLGPATAAGDFTGNSYYSGTECQHPGDSTPWPTPLLDVMVAINAAEFLRWGYSANRAIDHYEHTNRKIDMSAGGGPSSGTWAGTQLRNAVAARMEGDDDMPLTDDDKDWLRQAIRDEVQKLLTADQLVSTDDAAADGNPNTYTVAKGIGRSIRLSSLSWQLANGNPPR